jgi:hypothetical protein
MARASRLSAVAPFFTLAMASASSRAAAPEPPSAPAPVASSNEARAEARFREGSDAFDHGRIDEACVAFAESLKLYPTLGTLLNMALCHEKQGKTATAWREFSHAAAWATDAQRDRREFARRHANWLERGLSRVDIELTPGAPPVAVAIDGEPMSEVMRALPVFLDPGDHAVEASAPAHKTFATRVTVSAAPMGEVPVVRIPALDPEAAKPVPAPAMPVAETRAPAPPARVGGLALGGVGVVAVGVGTYFGIDALSKTGSLSGCAARCDGRPAQTSEAVSLVAFGTGLVALAAGAWLVLAPPSTGAKRGARGVVPWVGSREGGVNVVGAW